ncbi:hypothetical protein BD560DRAFT_426769 [Blakeslea trispora]|nr:hypothetical protein BD560DRAFT_426769 [Blakeslea trispora]
MQGHEQHQMRRDPLHMYFVMSMLCPLVVIRYLMRPASSESNSQQLTVDKEKFIWYDSQRFKAMKPPHLGWSSNRDKVSLEFRTMTSGNSQRERSHEHIRKKVDMNKSDIGWKHSRQLEVCLSKCSKAMTTNRAS